VAALTGGWAQAQTPDEVLLVVNQKSLVSRRIADYYVRKRGIPLANVCRVEAPPEEGVSREAYLRTIERPVAGCLARGGLGEKVLYVATTLGLPLRVTAPAAGPASEEAAVDSELSLLYGKMHGIRYPVSGGVPNPYFNRRDTPLRHPQVPIYLVTRLAGYDFDDVRAMIDRSAAAVNRGKVVIDLAGSGDAGDEWLKAAARQTPRERLVLDETGAVLYNQRDVIAYAAWGSNDKNRKKRMLGFTWLPGAIATEFVSTNARTFTRPPAEWNISTWKDTRLFFFDSPQTLTADYLHEGATGASGHVAEPYLNACPRPQLLIPAYLSGRTLAESFYLSIPTLSWMNIMAGDPLCRLRRQ
jgi:uncharacterized protein (TIGR03790 family)